MGNLNPRWGRFATSAATAFQVIWLAVSHSGATPSQSLDSVPTLVVFTPASVESDPQDQSLWVADQYFPRIAHFARDGSLFAVLPASAYGGGRPAGVTLEPGVAGHLYVSDPDQQRIVRVDRLGTPAGAFGTAILGIGNPADLALDPSDGTLYVADPTARQIFHILPVDSNSDGAPDGASLLGSFSTLPFGSNNPMGVALDPGSGHLFVSDPALDLVFELTVSGSQVASFDTGFFGGGSVTGLAWEPAEGSLRLADAGRKLLTVSPTGTLLGAWGTAPFGTLSPQGLAWDPVDSTMLAVSGERKMIRFQPEAPDAMGAVGGVFLHRQEWTSSFGSAAPVGVAPAASGQDRYIADSLQDRVFRVDPLGAVVSSFDTGAAGATSPTGITLGPGGTSFFLTDAAARKVFELSSSGTLLDSFSTSPFKHKPQAVPQCNNPQGITYDATRDHFFVVDSQVARVYEVTRTGSYVASFSTSPGAAYPTDVAVNPAADRLIVSDSSGFYAEYSRSGAFLVRYPGVPVRVRLSGGAGVSVDPATLQRAIFDPGQNAVLFLTPSGTALSQISLEPYGIRFPSGAAWWAPESKLFVVDSALDRFYSITGGLDGVFGNADDTSAWVSTVSMGSLVPAGVAVNTLAGKVGWVDEQTALLVWVTTGLSFLGSLDLTASGVTAPRGLDQDPTSADLLFSDAASGLLITDSSGNFLQSSDWSTLGIADPGGIGLSPAEGLLLAVDRLARTLVSVDMTGYFLPEIAGLQFVDDSMLTWTPSPVFASYRVFRGNLAALQSGSYGGCFWTGGAPPGFDPGIPGLDEGWFYLVAGKNTTGQGSLGTRSDGTPRPAGAVNPACP